MTSVLDPHQTYANIVAAPGTGKTEVSVDAIKIMLANPDQNDRPIIIACQTNHAVDQILLRIAEFTTEFVRLGGRSKDTDKIKARTLFEVRKQTSENRLNGGSFANANKKMKDMMKELELLLTPLMPGKLPLDFRLLERLELLSQLQADSLESGASLWVQDQLTNPNEARSPFTVWLGKALVTVPPKQMPEDFGFDYEEVDLEYEQLKGLEAENVAKDDEDHDSLSGKTIPIADNFTCRRRDGRTEAKDFEEAKEALKEPDMWKISEAVRPALYRYLQTEAKKKILAVFRSKTKLFNECAAKRRIGNWEQDETILKNQKVVGMTTTGFSKYRGLIAALEPKVVLIEEAAETLEAPIIVTCLPTLQHLILVGDHQQLRPHCHVKAHEDKPFYLNVSLFERLVKSKVEYDTLSKNRRMIPEVRRLLQPIYGNLIKDHASVLNPVNRPNVLGMGGVNSFFFTHNWSEQRDDQMSAYNPQEVDMIVGFVEYLIYNGTKTKDITVLTFYNGQRKKILSELRQRVSLAGERFNVVTVDSYQGEENAVVILSLVRSNDKGQIGFLANDNRVCVALSRAQGGFYLFGNGKLLYEHGKNKANPECKQTWTKVINIMANNGPTKDQLQIEPKTRLGDVLPVRCSNHNNLTEITDASDWEKISGGCEKLCESVLQCGHKCELHCHPFSDELVNCRRLCGKLLPCGHECQQECGTSACACVVCAKSQDKLKQITNMPHSSEAETPSRRSDSDSWRSFAEETPARYAEAVSAASSRRVSPEKNDSATDSLVDLGTTEGMKALSLGNKDWSKEDESLIDLDD